MEDILETIYRLCCEYHTEHTRETNMESFKSGCMTGAAIALTRIDQILKDRPGENEVRKVLRIEQLIRESKEYLNEVQ